MRVYLATGLTEVDRPDAHDEEADMTLEWYPLADAVRMVLSGEIVNAIAVAGILAAHAVDDGVRASRVRVDSAVAGQADGVRARARPRNDDWCRAGRRSCRATSTI